MLHAVVVGEGQGFALGVGEKNVHHHGERFLILLNNSKIFYEVS
jgi:hypothetical protein